MKGSQKRKKTKQSICHEAEVLGMPEEKRTLAATSKSDGLNNGQNQKVKQEADSHSL